MKMSFSCILRKDYQYRLGIKYFIKDANISWLVHNRFYLFTSFRSLMNLKFCKRDRKRKNTNIPLPNANSAKIK